MTPRVLLTNDDGPPDPKDSPYVLGLYLYLKNQLGWDVKVVLPSSQKSWIGKAYHIKEVVKGSYFYPKVDGTGDLSPQPRPLKEGELDEWILLDGTPASCASIALHNLYPEEIDLVISGPNLGRNTSAAFSLSSGTVGAAMSSSLSKKRAIALSYGTMVRSTPSTYFEPAHKLACRIIDHLWHNWGSDDCGLRRDEVDLYSINIPMIEKLLSDDGLEICWTTIWRNSYGRLFKSLSKHQDHTVNLKAPGPDTTAQTPVGVPILEGNEPQGLLFNWDPEMDGIISPPVESLPVGSDGWALERGWVSVTPLRATFGEAQSYHDTTNIEEIKWKVKLRL